MLAALGSEGCMKLDEIWEWVETEYDGSPSAFAIQLYKDLQEFVGDLSSEDPATVTNACRQIWCSSCIAFLCSIKTGHPIVTGAFEVPVEVVSHVYERGRQTRTAKVDNDQMHSYVYDHLCIELPHYTEEWIVIKDALDRRG
jgi:hypothetical protein